MADVCAICLENLEDGRPQIVPRLYHVLHGYGSKLLRTKMNRPIPNTTHAGSCCVSCGTFCSPHVTP